MRYYDSKPDTKKSLALFFWKGFMQFPTADRERCHHTKFGSQMLLVRIEIAYNFLKVGNLIIHGTNEITTQIYFDLQFLILKLLTITINLTSY